jgi:hypothetical protein
MPGLLAGPRPASVMPQTLCTAFSEARSYEQLRNEYHDGTPEAFQLAQTSRKTFKQSKRLNASALATLHSFYVSVGRLQAFWFYNPYEGSPVGSNYDATGASSTGRYAVAFRNDWTQTTGLARTDVSGLELIDLGSPDARYLALSGFGPHGAIVSATITVKASFTAGSSGIGVPQIDAVFGTVSIGTGDTSANKAAISLSGISTTPASFTYALTSGELTQIAQMSVVAFNQGTLYSGGYESPVTILNVYDVSLAITFADATTGTFRPTSYATATGENGGIFTTGVNGKVVNPLNAFDTDPTTYASVTRDFYNGLGSAGYLQLLF